MAQMTQTLPLLPLTSGVVLPGMVFTMALETEEARVAAEAAGFGRRTARCSCPTSTAATRSVGVVAEILERGELPGGPPAMVVRGLRTGHHRHRRARDRPGPVGPGRADQSRARRRPSVTELAREYRAVLENILLTRGARQIAERLRDVTEPSQIADLAGYSPDLSLAQKVEVLETVDVEARLRLVLGWARDTLADLTLREQIKTNVEEGMEKTQREFLLRRQLEAIRKELGELDGTSDDGTPDDYRPSDRRPRPARRRAHGAGARGRQARAHQRAEPRARLDPDVARHRPRDPVGRAVRRQPRRERGGPRPR